MYKLFTFIILYGSLAYAQKVNPSVGDLACGEVYYQNDHSGLKLINVGTNGWFGFVGEIKMVTKTNLCCACKSKQEIHDNKK